MGPWFGIITIVLCSAGYLLSWRYQADNKYRIAVLLLMVCGLALRIFISSDFFLHTWDEQFHALVAKNLIHHPLTPTLYDNPVLPYDYRDWTGNHIWVHKQPFPLWIMASSLWIFGIGEFALRLPSIILSTIGIVLSYYIGTYFFNKKTGFLTAFFFSINGLILELTGGRVATDHYDIFFLCLIELAVFLTILFVREKKTLYNILAGAAIGAAILTKWLPALIVLPIWVLVVYDSGKFRTRKIVIQFFVLLISCVAVSLPWQLYIFSAFPAEARWEASFNLRHLTEVIEGRTGPIYYFIDRIRINYGELIYLPLLWFLWKSLKNPKDLKLLAVTIWVMVPLLFFSLAKSKMQGYMLLASPALFMMTASFFLELSEYRKMGKFRWFYTLIMTLLIVLPVRYSIERMKPFENLDRSPQRIADYKRLEKKNIAKGVLFNCERPIEAMFYTNLTAYAGMPDSALVSDLTKKGYTVVLADSSVTGEYRIFRAAKQSDQP